MRRIDGIFRHEDQCDNCHMTRAAIEAMPSRGGFVNGVAVLFVLNEARPCQSYAIKEYWEDARITQPETARLLADQVLRTGVKP